MRLRILITRLCLFLLVALATATLIPIHAEDILSVSVSGHSLNITVSIPSSIPNATALIVVYRVDEEGALEIYEMYLLRAEGGSNLSVIVTAPSGSYVVKAMLWSSLLEESINRVWYTYGYESRLVTVR